MQVGYREDVDKVRELIVDTTEALADARTGRSARRCGVRRGHRHGVGDARGGRAPCAGEDRCQEQENAVGGSCARGLSRASGDAACG
ncbi:hypothetical protein ACU686_44130 [Yinghuangia aomiensis]